MIIVSVDTDEHGLVPSSLNNVADGARLLYALPNFQNPTGRSLSVERRLELVETCARLGVPLMNYTGKPIAKLEVKLTGLTGAKTIRSIERGVLKPETRDGATFVTLPLNVADMLLIDR